MRKVKRQPIYSEAYLVGKDRAKTHALSTGHFNISPSQADREEFGGYRWGDFQRGWRMGLTEASGEV